jgi:hypothetical protein
LIVTVSNSVVKPPIATPSAEVGGSLAADHPIPAPDNKASVVTTDASDKVCLTEYGDFV